MIDFMLNDFRYKNEAKYHYDLVSSTYRIYFERQNKGSENTRKNREFQSRTGWRQRN